MRKYLFLTLIFLMSCLTPVYAESESVVCNATVSGRDVSITGHLPGVTGIQQMTLLVGNVEDIVYINQFPSNIDGTFGFDFSIADNVAYGTYEYKVGNTANFPVYTGTINIEPDLTVEELFTDTDLRVSINGYVPEIEGTISCTEGKTVNINITNVTDNTVIANDTVTADSNLYNISYTLPELYRSKDYTVTVSYTNANGTLASLNLNIHTSLLLVTITGIATTADNVSVSAHLKTENSDILDKNVLFSGSEQISMSVPNLVSGASFVFDLEGYETVKLTSPEVIIPEQENTNINNALLINSDENYNFSIGSSGAEAWYKFVPKVNGTYSINIPEGYVAEVRENMNGITNVISAENQLYMSYPKIYFIKVTSLDGSGGHFTLHISSTNSKVSGKAFYTTILNDEYYSNIKDNGILYKNGEKLNLLNPVTWLCDFNNTLYFNAQGHLRKLSESSFDIVGNSVDARYITSDENSIYFSNWSDSGKLYKGTLTTDGQMEFTKICEDSVSWIVAENDYLYYRNTLDGNRVYRILKTEKNSQTGELIE